MLWLGYSSRSALSICIQQQSLGFCSYVPIVAGFTHGETATMLQAVGIIIVLGAVAFQNELHIALLDRLGVEKREEDEIKLQSKG
jgi:hypothetical protein